MATNIRKTTTASNVKQKYTEIRDTGRKLQQLVKEVCINQFDSRED